MFIFRSAVRVCQKRPPEETNTDQEAKLEGEVSQSSDYQHLIREKTPPTGRLEDLQLTEDRTRLSVGLQKVKP